MMIKDFEDFEDWVHVISYPIVVRVYACEIVIERESTKVKNFGSTKN